jgi:hypothetical protein
MNNKHFLLHLIIGQKDGSVAEGTAFKRVADFWICRIKLLSIDLFPYPFPKFKSYSQYRPISVCKIWGFHSATSQKTALFLFQFVLKYMNFKKQRKNYLSRISYFRDKSNTAYINTAQGANKTLIGKRKAWTALKRNGGKYKKLSALEKGSSIIFIE